MESTLILEKTFACTAENLWDAWTNPTILREWSCPFGFTISVCEGEFRVGGIWNSSMTGEDGTKMSLRGEYLELDAPHKIVSKSAWILDDGSTGEETTYTVEIEQIENETKMKFSQTGFTNEYSLEGSRGGWSEAFQKLEKTLTK